MFDIDIIIPCYGKSELINRGVSSLATQWHKEFIHVTLVNDCSPNTDNNYQDLVDRYKDEIDIRCIKMPKNSGQGLTRQFGIDNTKHQWFMFMDEDDQLAPLTVSIFCGAVESYGVARNPDGSIIIDKQGNVVREKNIPDLAIVSGPLFEFDDNHTHVIPNDNRIWLNCKLYNRKFLKAHNLRFNERQSRHAEDYYFMSCFFHALDNDAKYTGILLNNDGILYLWYPNEESQSRVDPHYGFMLSGYTMEGSVNILKYMKSKNNNIKWTREVQQQYDSKLLNMTVYSFYTFLSFIRHVASTDYVPKLEDDWYILRDACHEMQKMTKANWKKYNYMQYIEQLFMVKNHSDVQYTEPWIDFEKYIQNGMEEFEWSFEQLLECKEKYKFNKEGIRMK